MYFQVIEDTLLGLYNANNNVGRIDPYCRQCFF